MESNESENSSHAEPGRDKKRRRAIIYAVLFVVWVVVGAGLFLHMWENRGRNITEEDDAFRVWKEERNGVAEDE